MKKLGTFFVPALIPLGASVFAAEPAGKPPAPQKVAPVTTVKDLALREASACDANHNGRIDAAEFSQLRIAQSKNPNGYLYLFDLNENKYLEDSELSKIKFARAKPSPAHQPPTKKK